MAFDYSIAISLATLTLLEIILGIDNILVISILSKKLPAEKQHKARVWGLGFALFARVLLLLGIVWVIGLTIPLFSLFNIEFTIRDLILFAGGLFLLYKATYEIHHTVDQAGEIKQAIKTTFFAVIAQIVLLDLVFSLDSVITAIGMAQQVWVMVLAIVAAMMLMLMASRQISDFIHAHPSVKILALSFLLMIGITLVAEGIHFHIPKGYIYFSMGFAGFVEWINLIRRKKVKEKKILSNPAN